MFIVSIDLELAWGFNYELLKNSRIALKYVSIIKERSRRNVRTLLGYSERFNIPFTWGIVGHLFLPSCSRVSDSLSHPDMPRPELDAGKDWYANDPCSDLNASPSWYGSDLIEQILKSETKHEIASHSFSHVDFSRCSREVALSEIRKCKEIMKEYNVEPKTFIFPEDKVGHLDILREEGFKLFRFKPEYPWHNVSLGRAPARFLTLLDSVQETVSPKVSEPIEASGLIGLPWSLLFQSSHQRARAIDVVRLITAARRGVDKAVSENRIFHLTMHDYLEDDRLIYALSSVLSYVSKLRDRDRLHAETMYSGLSANGK